MGRHGGPRSHRHGGPPWADFRLGDVVEQRFFERAWGGGGRRMRRGDVKAEVLSALVDGPAHGYEVIRRLEEKSGGMWRPSPGSVYPTLQMLEDAGLVRASEQDGRRTYELTDEGRTEAEQSGGEDRDWDNQEMGGRLAARNAMVQLHMAARQVATSGTADQVDRAAAVLRQARQSLYQILAED
ncbi:MAG TPA: PadR family transcriptional regulator [Acidimicrobiales bacterium]|nr:PadR family transcriptional regulator [Acidimicrobiales bacterium]